MKNALCCFLLLVLVFGACFHLPFVAFCCSSLLFLVFEIESILSQKPKQANAFYCSLWLFVARFGFLWMFPFEHRIARCGFLLVRKTKTSNERQKMSKWKPGFKPGFHLDFFCLLLLVVAFYCPFWFFQPRCPFWLFVALRCLLLLFVALCCFSLLFVARSCFSWLGFVFLAF